MHQEPSRDMGTIPGPLGLPVIGNLPRLLPNPLPYVKRLQQRYGNVFYAGFAFNRRSVFLLGTEATERALIDRDASFSSTLGYASQSAYIGGAAVLFRDGGQHRSLRQAMNGAFSASALDRYLETMHTHVAEHVRRWSVDGVPTDLAADVRLLSLDIAAETIAGARIEEDAAFVNEHFVNMLGAMVSLFPRFPGSPKWRGAKSRKCLDRYFRSQIARRRTSRSTDLFSEIIRAADGMGAGEDDVLDNMLGLLVASYETTASTIAMLLYSLAVYPAWQERLRAEMSRDGGAPQLLDRKALDQMIEAEWVLKETLRLYPPLSYLPRRTIRAVEIDGHVIPPNTSVTIAPAFTHQLASIYREPERFDPLRFSPERTEDKAHPCAWIPFGKGAHTCMGMHFARMEIKAFLAHVLRKFRIVATDNRSPSMTYVPVLRPAAPMPVTLARL